MRTHVLAVLTYRITPSRSLPPLFFFSSRRRHTRCSRDWSSDVCSSDLRKQAFRKAARALRERQAAQGLEPRQKATIGNGICEWKTVEEEKQARQETAEEQIGRASCRERV